MVRKARAVIFVQWGGLDTKVAEGIRGRAEDAVVFLHINYPYGGSKMVGHARNGGR
jgi:hypothetical protein